MKCKWCDQNNYARWQIKYTQFFRNEYHVPDWVPICSACLARLLDGGYSGGGPTECDIENVRAISYYKRKRKK